MWPMQCDRGRGFPPYDSHIIRFTTNGARWVLMADASKLLGKAVTSLRDICKAKQYPICVSDKPALLTILRQQELVKTHASCVALLRLGDLHKLATDIRAPEVLLQALRHLIATSTDPPPQRYTIATSALLATGTPSSKYATYVFPTTLPPAMDLLPEQRKAKYALDDPPRTVAQEIQDFMHWSALPVNLERSERYSSGVQSTTLEKVPQKVLGFLGYISRKYAITQLDINLALFDNPKYCIDFVSYLIARDVGLGHLR